MTVNPASWNHPLSMGSPLQPFSQINPGQNGYSQSSSPFTPSHPSCMSPQANLPSYMTTTNQHFSPHGQPPFSSQNSPLMPSAPPSSTHPSPPISAPNTVTSGNQGGGYTPEIVPPDRRSNSIAALRMKAKEHSVAMGMIGAYWQIESVWSKIDLVSIIYLNWRLLRFSKLYNSFGFSRDELCDVYPGSIDLREMFRNLYTFSDLKEVYWVKTFTHIYRASGSVKEYSNMKYTSWQRETY